MNHTRCVQRWPLLLLALLIALTLPACAAPDPTFVVAARETHDTIAPEYLAYVDADPLLTEKERKRRHRTVELFDEAIRSREARR